MSVFCQMTHTNTHMLLPSLALPPPVLSTIYNESSYLSSLREIDYRSLFFRWRIKFHVCKSRAGLISQRPRCCTGRHMQQIISFFCSHLRFRHPPPDVTNTLANPLAFACISPDRPDPWQSEFSAAQYTEMNFMPSIIRMIVIPLPWSQLRHYESV